MRIGIASYFSPESIGGTETQTHFTMDALKKLGHEVTYIKHVYDLDKVDIFHVFNSCKEAYLNYCKRRKKPIVLSTIYWNPYELFQYEQNLFGLIQDVNTQVENHKRNLRTVLPYVNMLLPNSYTEYGIFLSDFNCPKIPYRIVPNGIDKPNLNWEWRPPVRDYILCVGRIEVRKNQLQLINATPKDIPLVFIGNSGITNRYITMCMEAGERRGNTYFYDAVPHKELWDWLWRCKVYCQPSWYETPGLVSLMAASINKSLLLTNRGSCTEVFEAIFSTPCSVEHLSQQVDYTYTKEPISNTDVHYWDEVADLTQSIYQQVI